jgi:DNA-binding protein HU-beta
MNKQDFIKKMANKADLPLSKTQKSLDSILAIVERALSEGERVNFLNFGSFITNERKARKGRNPLTGEVIEIPASKSVKFRPGKKLTEMVQ